MTTDTDAMLKQLSLAVAAEVDLRFRELQQSHPGETFYGIATCHETDTFSCYLAAQSREAVERELETRSARSGTPIDQLSRNLYFVPSWAYADDRALVLRLHRQVWEVAEGAGEPWRQICRRVFDAYVEGLRLFEANGGLAGFDREGFILVPWVNDPDEEGKWVAEAVDRLNPSSVATAFRREYGYA